MSNELNRYRDKNKSLSLVKRMERVALSKKLQELSKLRRELDEGKQKHQSSETLFSSFVAEQQSARIKGAAIDPALMDVGRLYHEELCTKIEKEKSQVGKLEEQYSILDFDKTMSHKKISTIEENLARLKKLTNIELEKIEYKEISHRLGEKQ